MPLDDHDHGMIYRGLKKIASANDSLTEELSGIRVALEKIGKEFAILNEREENR